MWRGRTSMKRSDSRAKRANCDPSPAGTSLTLGLTSNSLLPKGCVLKMHAGSQHTMHREVATVTRVILTWIMPPLSSVSHYADACLSSRLQDQCFYSPINLRIIKTTPSKDSEGRVTDIWRQISPEVKAMTSGMCQAEGPSIIFSLPLVTTGTRAECVR